jgi:HK97 family phage portal protein
MGPVQAAMIDLDSARYSAEWNRNFFLNSAEPGGIIQVDKRLTDDEFNEMTDRWREQHQGVSQAHRVAVIEQGQWVNRSMSMRDMQFQELRNVSREIIREAFGIHAHMLGISEDVNKANAEAGEMSFARWLVKPRCERIKQVLNSKLLPMFGATSTGVEFDHDRVVPEDREADDRERTSKAQAAQLLVVAGYDPAAVALAVGLPDMAYTGPPGAKTTPPAA